jgi:xylulose-5-phosphate/fructose-6-phosphate phosphoketolase
MEIVNAFKKLHRLTNYMSVAQLYLKDNYYLENELQQDHLKTRPLGHWGTVPGINFIYGGLTYMIRKTNKDVLLVVGPGHGAPAIISNLYLEGTLGDINPRYKISKTGMANVIHDFSWANGFDSHTSPKLPGSIHEGGELGYSLAASFGTVLDNPNLITACIVGDGEAETATLAASWQLNKFLNPSKDGVVLPILHLNGYKISCPTIFSTMSDAEITNYFRGLNYDPIIVDQYISEDIYIDYLQALITAFEKIEYIKCSWTNYSVSNPSWPIIIMRTKKGWTMPKQMLGKDVEDTHLSHGMPLKNPAKNYEEYLALKEWLSIYNIAELFDSEGMPSQEIMAMFPEPHKCIGANKYAYATASKLILPSVEDHELKNFEPGQRPESRMAELSQYLRDVFDLNKSNQNFIMFSPDESESNMLEPVFQQTDRKYIWRVRAQDEHFSTEGRVVELLSENVLFSMYVGYVTTGRHGILISYEAFLNIISSQIDQHIKFLKQRKSQRFLKAIPSINLVATSTLWRQEHNGFSHQNPTLINSLITKYSDFVNLYFPPDANSLMVAIENCFISTDQVNYITVCKKNLPQWLSLKDAKLQFKKGYGHWNFLENKNDQTYDVVLVSIGDYNTHESVYATKILKKLVPELNFKFININQLTQKGLGNSNNPIDKTREMHTVFEEEIDVIFNFHGYPTAIQQLLWNTELSSRAKIFGYMERGHTTTPLNMHLLNHTSRYHMAMEAILSASKYNKIVESKKTLLLNIINDMISDQLSHIIEFNEDLNDNL